MIKLKGVMHLRYQERLQTIKQWSKELGICPYVVTGRIKCGWSDVQALTVEVRPKRSKDIQPQFYLSD